MEPMTILGPKNERRCATCGARASGRACPECGASVTPRTEIGILAGVNNNFGTVNNVYNIGNSLTEDPEVVDLRDVQDGLNQRFPERIPGPPNLPTFAPSTALPPGPSQRTIRTVNMVAAIAGIIMAMFAIGVAAALLWL